MTARAQSTIQPPRRPSTPWIAYLVGICVPLALGLEGLLSQPPAEVQLLDNGGFEKGLKSWQPAPGHKLIADPGAAHSGTNCLYGALDRPDRAWILRRTVNLRRGAVYRLVVWARARGRVRLVIWRRTGDQREFITAFNSVAPRWKPYVTRFSVPSDGPTTIEIVAPSTFGTPQDSRGGEMWIDDIGLYEMTLPPQKEISGGVGFNDFPVMAPAGADRAWAAWLSFRNGHDTLQAALLDIRGGEVNVEKTWQIDGGRGVYLLHPAIASAGDGSAWLAWASEAAGNWDIHVCRLTPAGPRKPVRLTKSKATDIHPALAQTPRGLLVAWETNRDDSTRQIYAGFFDGARLRDAKRLSESPISNYSPSVAARGTAAWVVWHGWRSDNYDLYGRRWSDGRWSRELRLTYAPAVDRDAFIAAGPNGFWLAWEHTNYRKYLIGWASQKQVRIARLTDDGRLEAPAGIETTQLWRKAEVPTLAFDDRGRLWVAARQPRGTAGWDVIVLAYSGNRWSPARLVAWQKGMCRRPTLVPVSGGMAVCYQADDTPPRWYNVDESVKGTSRIAVALAQARWAPSPHRITMKPFVEPQEDFEAGKIRHDRGEDRPGWTIEYHGKKLRLFFGDLHEHTDVSICNRTADETQEQSYAMMRDIARFDFGALTDHGYNFNAYLWNRQGEMARSQTDPGRFLAFLAEEWTSTFEKYSKKYPYGYYGHRNLLLEDPYFPIWFNAFDGKTPPQVWEILRKRHASFVHIPHQLADTGNVPVAWEFNNRLYQPVAEIFQARGSYEYYGCPRQAKNTTPKGWFLQDAWARGIVIGVVAAPDHTGGFGKAGVYAAELSRKAIIEALRARHTFGTTGARIFLDVRVNGLLMGEIGPPPAGRPVRIHIRADCPQPIRVVEVCRNNVFIMHREIGKPTCDLRLVDRHPLPGNSYYYVRLIQEDDEIAWSSPVWLGDPRQKR